MNKFSQPFSATIPGFSLSRLPISDPEFRFSFPSEMLSEFDEPFFFLELMPSNVELEKLL
jgi:hypothetical protein